MKDVGDRPPHDDHLQEGRHVSLHQSACSYGPRLRDRTAQRERSREGTATHSVKGHEERSVDLLVGLVGRVEEDALVRMLGRVEERVQVQAESAGGAEEERGRCAVPRARSGEGQVCRAGCDVVLR